MIATALKQFHIVRSIVNVVTQRVADALIVAELGYYHFHTYLIIERFLTNLRSVCCSMMLTVNCYVGAVVSSLLQEIATPIM